MSSGERVAVLRCQMCICKPREGEILVYLRKREHRHQQGFGRFLAAKVKATDNHGSGGSMTWLDLETDLCMFLYPAGSTQQRSL